LAVRRAVWWKRRTHFDFATGPVFRLIETGVRKPMGEAIEWVARITAVALTMVLPGIAGQWMDRRFGTNYCGLSGFALGLVLGISTLLALVKRPRP
jgi:uncharacterized protein YqgC (DUF456 family)